MCQDVNKSDEEILNLALQDMVEAFTMLTTLHGQWVLRILLNNNINTLLRGRRVAIYRIGRLRKLNNMPDTLESGRLLSDLSWHSN